MPIPDSIAWATAGKLFVSHNPWGVPKENRVGISRRGRVCWTDKTNASLSTAFAHWLIRSMKWKMSGWDTACDGFPPKCVATSLPSQKSDVHRLLVGEEIDSGLYFLTVTPFLAHDPPGVHTYPVNPSRLFLKLSAVDIDGCATH